MPNQNTVSMDHVHFLLDCFVVSAGSAPPQLGRYHPESNPEEFVKKEFINYTLKGNGDEEQRAVLREINSPSHKDAGSSSPFQWSEEEGDDYTFEDFFPRNFSSTDPAKVLNPINDNLTDSKIGREISDMRAVLQRFLNAPDPELAPALFDILEWFPENGIRVPPEVGEWELCECGICFESQWLNRRMCCRFPACPDCLQVYFRTKVDEGEINIHCCNNVCSASIHRDEISAHFSMADKERFHKLLNLANQDANTKTCPQCSFVTKLFLSKNNWKNQRKEIVTCPACKLEWCFLCHAPWHSGLSCKQFRKGDRLLHSWARERKHGQPNAQKCPSCKIYIERSSGCDHMHCSKCKTDFCYKCGEKYRYLKFFGDHYSKLSVFGCKYRFKADQPFQRKVIRGAIFGGKLFAAPLVSAIAVCAGALAVGVSILVLPVYSGIRIYRQCAGRRVRVTRKHAPAYNIPNINFSHPFP